MSVINVTKPFLPPKDAYLKYVDGIYERNWLTNDGPLLKQLEKELNEFLKVEHACFVANGTLALQLAFKALKLKGEVITTPFSYVATTSSLVWEGLTPVFVDIDENTWNIDPFNIEKAITPKTSAILATHVFGIPCAIEAIEEIARKHRLKVIYDASHCFGVEYHGQSIFKYGDMSTCSFHATKLFHTIEGGSVFVKDHSLNERIRYLRNFGHDGFDKFNGVGINAKNSEFHAAMGLCNLPYVADLIDKRQNISACYDTLLAKKFKRPVLPEGTRYNYAYYPIVFPSEQMCLAVKENLESHAIYPRRYFYPLLQTLDYIEIGTETPIAESISHRVLCLPLFDSLELDQVEVIANLILDVC